MTEYSGRIYAYNDGKRVHVCADNHGSSPGTLTHCILPTEELAREVAPGNGYDTVDGGGSHDDTAYGHGNPVPYGRPDRPGVISQAFPIGGQYNSVTYKQRRPTIHNVAIQPGAWFRAGFRGEAFAAFQIPERGQLVEIPYEEMHWYGRGRATPLPPADRDADDHLPPAIQALLQNRSPQVVVGKARIVPVQGALGTLKGWEVWFENEARGRPQKGQTHGFTGTVVLLNDRGEGAKNAGLGLESMGCPAGDHAAVQFIAHNGDYGARQFGVRALPGTNVRLGIRGHSTFDTTLPTVSEGERSISLRTFSEAGEEKNSAWFDGDLLMEKMGEKKGMVDFFRKGARINDELADTVYVGREAFERAQFKNPPRVRIRWLHHSTKHPGGGWEIKVRSLLPAKDDLGRVGFTAQLKFKGNDEEADSIGPVADPSAVPPESFSPEKREFSWFIPYRQQVAGVIAEPGQALVVDTGSLGWRAEIPLPKQGIRVDTSTAEEEIWFLRESDYKRAGLYPKGEGTT